MTELYDLLMQDASEVVEDSQEFTQPELSIVPRFRVKQPLSMQCPEETKDGQLYDKSGFFDPTDELLVTYSDSEKSRRLSTKLDKPDPHCVCFCPQEATNIGLPWKNENGRWLPGSGEPRNCNFCSHLTWSKGTPKLDAFNEPNLGDNTCGGFHTWLFLLMQDADDTNGTPMMLEYGRSFFTKEYRNMPMVAIEGKLYFSWEGIQRQLLKKKLLTQKGEVPIKFSELQRLKLSVRTTRLVVNGKPNYAPIFAIVGVWKETEHIFQSIRSSRELMPLHSASQLALHADSYEEPLALNGGVDGDAFDVSKYSAPDNDEPELPI